MVSPQTFSRDILYHRHHMSHQQIDDYLGENKSGLYPELKGQLLGKVGDFKYISMLFRDNDIEFIPLKGPVLSYRLYKDMSYRNFGDLDFQMEKESIEKVLPILKEEGYHSQSYEWHKDNNQLDAFFNHFHHLVIDKPDSNIHLELHWRLNNYKIGGSGITNDIIVANTNELVIEDDKYKVFTPEFELLYLIIHGGLHGWQWLRWLVDIKVFLEKTPIDQAKFKQLVDRLQAHRLVLASKKLLSDYFPGSETLLSFDGKPSTFLYKYSKKQLQMESDGDFSFRGRLKHHWYRLKCFPGIKYKTSVLKHIFLYPEQLENDALASNRITYYLGGIYNKIKRRL